MRSGKQTDRQTQTSIEGTTTLACHALGLSENRFTLSFAGKTQRQTDRQKNYIPTHNPS